MGRQKGSGVLPGQHRDKITSVKCWERIAKIITLLAKYKEKSQQEVIEEYETQLTEDLLRQQALQSQKMRPTKG